MTDSAETLATCKESLSTLMKVSHEIILCTQGDVLGFSRLADLQAAQVKQVRIVEVLMKKAGDFSYTDQSIRDQISAIEKMQLQIDYNLKVHAHLMSEELSQLRDAKVKLHSLDETYTIKFKRSKNNLDTRS